jgi:murein DD-endopeptidase MepM/ murein hydrolase activator NlpD
MSSAFGNASATPSLGLPMPAGLDQDAPAADPITASGLLGPTGRVSSAFGWRNDPFDGAVKFHSGTDIAMPVGQDVLAAQAGRVESVGDVPGYGLTVLVRHQGGISTRYAHLSEATVKAGEAVTQGQVIAKSGSSGKSTGPHLHFEVLKDGQSLDPGRW